MGLFSKHKTVYGSSVQFLPMANAEDPFSTMLDYNLSYLDGSVDLVKWAHHLYYKNGKGQFKAYSNYIKKLIKNNQNPFNNYIAIDSDKSYDTDNDTLVELLVTDQGYSMSEVQNVAVMVFNANEDELTYIHCTLGDYNFDDDNITIDGVVYTIKEYWFDDINTIRVYLVDADGNEIQKTIPSYRWLNTGGDNFIASEYLYVEFTTITDDKTHVYISPIPANGTISNYVYTSTKAGTTCDYTKRAEKTKVVLPMMPLKEGGNGMGWGPSTVTEKRNLPKTSSLRDKTDNWDLTGINGDPPTVVKNYYKSDKKRSKLYKSAEWYAKCSNYKIYKNCMKKAGTTIESQMCVLYDTQCGFTGSDTATLRKQLYDCYMGFGCPMHAIKTSNVYTQPNSSFNSIYSRLLQDTRHPILAKYAKYTRYTDDEIFETDKETDSDSETGYTYQHKHFAEINPKKYRPAAEKAVAKYCFNYFNLYKGTSGGKRISISQRQGYNYRATHSWTQYRKQKHVGQYKYRYGYDFNATLAQTIYIYEITYTGKMRPFCTVVYKTEYSSSDDNEGHDVFFCWHVHYKPVFLVKKYECQIESEIGEAINIYESLGGTPVYANYYEQTQEMSPDDVYDSNPHNAKYKLLSSNVRIGSMTNVRPTLNITMKRLCSIKETVEIEESNILFAYGDNALKSAFWDRHVYIDENGDELSYPEINYRYKKGYCVDKTSITTAIFDTDNIEVSLIPWTAKDLYYDDTYRVRSDGRKVAKYMDKDNPPTADRTDISYNNFTECLFPEKGTTYMTLKNDDDWEGERIIFKYFHNVDKNHYEEIRVEDYRIEWVINPREGGQHKAGSLSCLAPDGNSFLPIVLDIVPKLSFYDGVIIYQYAQKQYWSYWMKKRIKISRLGAILGIVLMAICVAAAVFTGGASMGVALAVTAGLVALHFILKLTGLNNTVFGMVIETAANIAAAVVTGGASLVLTVLSVISQVINFCLNIHQYMLNNQMEDAERAYKRKIERVNDKTLELQNLETKMSEGLSTLAAINRVRRQGTQKIALGAVTPLGETFYKNTVVSPCNMDKVLSYYANHCNIMVTAYTHSALEYA